MPYKIRNGEVSVFLQKKEEVAKMLPGRFVFFGGKMEQNETPEEAMKREISEELNFLPKGYEFLNFYNFENGLNFHMFMLEVDDDFESSIKILGGEYGEWFSESNVLDELKLTEEGRIILRDCLGS